MIHDPLGLGVDAPLNSDTTKDTKEKPIRNPFLDNTASSMIMPIMPDAKYPEHFRSWSANAKSFLRVFSPDDDWSLESVMYAYRDAFARLRLSEGVKNWTKDLDFYEQEELVHHVLYAMATYQAAPTGTTLDVFFSQEYTESIDKLISNIHKFMVSWIKKGSMPFLSESFSESTACSLALISYLRLRFKLSHLDTKDRQETMKTLLMHMDKHAATEWDVLKNFANQNSKSLFIAKKSSYFDAMNHVLYQMDRPEPGIRIENSFNQKFN